MWEMRTGKQGWSYELRGLGEAGEEDFGGTFLANCQVVPYPPDAQNSAGIFVFSPSSMTWGLTLLHLEAITDSY